MGAGQVLAGFSYALRTWPVQRGTRLRTHPTINQPSEWVPTVRTARSGRQARAISTADMARWQ
jgi:hypothetical protein